MFSKKNKTNKYQLLETEISNYKSQMISLSQNIQELRNYIIKQDEIYQNTMITKELEIQDLKKNIKYLQTQHIDSIPEEYICKICMENKIDCILEPCMHFIMCQKCIEELTDRKCPICRQDCTFYNKIFIS